MTKITKRARERAWARASWPMRRFALGAEPSEYIGDQTSAEERLAMMGELALEAWSLSGRTLPSYERASVPGRVVRGRP